MSSFRRILSAWESIRAKHWLREWVSIRAGLDARARMKLFSPAGDRISVFQCVVRPCTD